MPLSTKIKVVRLDDVCGAEDAEGLLEWLDEHPSGKVNMKQCTQLHSAILQVLLVRQPTISAWPIEKNLHALLKATRLGLNQIPADKGAK